MTRVLAVGSDTHHVRADVFRDALPGYEVEAVEVSRRGDTEAELEAALADAAAAFVRAGPITERVIAAAPDLRAIAIHGSGYGGVDLDAATRHGIVVTHNPEAVAPGVIEHTVGFMLSLLHEFPRLFERTAAGGWAEPGETVGELGRRTVGVVGLGTIGLEVATVAGETFGAEVLGYDPYVTGERTSSIYPRTDRDAVEAAGVELVDWESLFERADLVTLHVPLTEETAGMVGERELAALAGGYLLNTCRGGVVDEAALIEAVERGDLAGVALDVLETEPPEPDNPLLGAENVYVTPHIAGPTEGYLERAAEVAAEKIRTVLEGGRPDYVVNPAVFD